MARKPRLEYPGALLHVIARGNNRQAVSWDDREWKTFLKILVSVVDMSKWCCKA
jgi:hypothetical protein